MVQIKAWLVSLDAFWLLVSGYSFIDIASTLVAGNLAMSSFENLIKLLLSMAGFVYLCARTYHFIMKSSLERELLKEDIIAKRNENFPKRFKKEFIDRFEKDENDNNSTCN